MNTRLAALAATAAALVVLSGCAAGIERREDRRDDRQERREERRDLRGEAMPGVYSLAEQAAGRST